jgi:hypothetical protein
VTPMPARRRPGVLAGSSRPRAALWKPAGARSSSPARTCCLPHTQPMPDPGVGVAESSRAPATLAPSRPPA